MIIVSDFFLGYIIISMTKCVSFKVCMKIQYKNKFVIKITALIFDIIS